MVKRILLALSLVAIAHIAQADATTIRLTLSVAPGATVPADHYRVKEKIGTTWKDPAGLTGPFIVPAPAAFIDVPTTTAVNPTFEVIPIANGKEGTPSNSCTTLNGPSDEKVSIVCSTVPAPPAQ